MQIGMARILKQVCPDKFDEYYKIGEELEKKGIDSEQEQKEHILPAPQKIAQLFNSVPSILSDAEIDALPAHTDGYSDADTVFGATYKRGFPLFGSKKGVKHARSELKRIEKARHHMLKGMQAYVERIQFPFLIER